MTPKLKALASELKLTGSRGQQRRPLLVRQEPTVLIVGQNIGKLVYG